MGARFLRCEELDHERLVVLDVFRGGRRATKAPLLTKPLIWKRLPRMAPASSWTGYASCRDRPRRSQRMSVVRAVRPGASTGLWQRRTEHTRGAYYGGHTVLARAYRPASPVLVTAAGGTKQVGGTLRPHPIAPALPSAAAGDHRRHCTRYIGFPVHVACRNEVAMTGQPDAHPAGLHWGTWQRPPRAVRHTGSF